MIFRIVGPCSGYFVALVDLPQGDVGDLHLGMYRIFGKEPADPFEAGALAEGTTAEPRASRRQALEEAEDAAFEAVARLPGQAAPAPSRAGLQGVAYVSTAVGPPQARQLEALLCTARERNARLGVTGMLLYEDGQFMQYFEGPAPHVELIYRIIRKSPLHRGIVELMRTRLPQRLFPSWSMAFQPGPCDLWAGQLVEPVLDQVPDSLPRRLLQEFLARGDLGRL